VISSFLSNSLLAASLLDPINTCAKISEGGMFRIRFACEPGAGLSAPPLPPVAPPGVTIVADNGSSKFKEVSAWLTTTCGRRGVDDG
jgi:hypothetical protein